MFWLTYFCCVSAIQFFGTAPRGDIWRIYARGGFQRVATSKKTCTYGRSRNKIMNFKCDRARSFCIVLFRDAVSAMKRKRRRGPVRAEFEFVELQRVALTLAAQKASTFHAPCKTSKRAKAFSCCEWRGKSTISIASFTGL